MAQRPGYIDTQNFGLDELFFADALTLTRPFPLHRHSFVELHYIRGGSGTEIINGTAYPLSAGCFSVKMPWHTHELIPAETLDTFKCSFRIAALEGGGVLESVSAVLAKNYDFCPMAQVPAENRRQAEGLFADLVAESRHTYPMKEEQMAAQVAQLLVVFLRNLKKTTDGVPGSTADDILKQMNLRCRERDLTCATIAEAVSYSESQVGRMLEERFHMTFGELLREIRIRNACVLLKTTDIPVESIALWAGYSSRDGFYQAFQKERGMTPADYRRSCVQSRDEKGIRVESGIQLYAKVIYYVHRHYSEEITGAGVAKRFSCSESFLKRVLADQMTSFPRLLKEIRVYHARQLLTEEELTVEAVGLAVGFSSPETFYRAFHKLTGMTPMEYRRMADDGKTDK